MAIHGFPGGVISATAPTTSPSGASGVWTLDDQLQAGANWPVTPALATRSLRFRASASAYMNRTPASSPTSNQKGTFSFWFKRGLISSATEQWLFAAGSSSLGCYIPSADRLGLEYFGGSYLVTTQVFRDPSAWYHVVIAIDSTQATASNRAKVYVNGVQVTSFATEQYPSQNATFNWMANGQACFINQIYSTGRYFDGYMAEWNYIDGQALTPNYFGATNPSTGAWQPATYRGTYGTNGFYLPFTSNTVYFSGLFDGSSQTAYAGYNNVLNLGTTDYTVEAFVNPTSLSNAGGQQQVIGRWVDGSNRRSYLLTVNNDGSVTWNASTNGLSGAGNSTSVSSSAGAVTINTWTHIRISQSGGTVYLGINGTIVTTATNSIFNNVYTSTDPVALGSSQQGSTNTVFTGRISNVRIVKGTALSTSSYTVPTAPLTAISGTSLLTLQSSTLVDNSGNSLTITDPAGNPTISTNAPTQFGAVGYGTDFSGNGNNWTTNNLSYTVGTTYDSMTDVPTNTNATTANFATLNPLSVAENVLPNLSNGNLTCNSVDDVTQNGALATIGVQSGKFYFEGRNNTTVIQSTNIGLVDKRNNPNSLALYIINGSTSGLTGSPTFSAYGNGDIIGVAFDMDAKTVTFYKNGVMQGTGAYGFTYTSGDIFPAVYIRDSAIGTWDVNFGQRPFAYTPPSGFVALNTFNLPTPTIGATASTLANKYMDATTYTANGTTQTITNSGSMQPDLVWTKRRDSTSNHLLIDSVRGVGLNLSTNSTAAQVTDSVYLTSFNSNGFSIGSGNYGNGNTMVAWQWNAGGSTVTNTSGSISTQVRANTTAGFSIVTYTGVDTPSTNTIGHGLGVAPTFWIIKNRSGGTGAYNWVFNYVLNGVVYYLFMNATQTVNAQGSPWSTLPTSSVITLGANDTNTCNAGDNYVAYCFSPVAGYSAFGSYAGNGSTDGTFVYTGFRPRFILIKASSTAQSWQIYDTARSPSNLNSLVLFPNLANAEQNSSSAASLDALSNGFKLRVNDAGSNGSGNTYVYAAFAESPFKFANAR